MPHTLLSHNAQAPDPQTSDPDKLCTQTERFHHVGSPTHPRVVHNCQLGADARVDDVFEGVQRGDGSVDLAAGVVGNDDAINSERDAFLRVGYRLNPIVGIVNSLKGHMQRGCNTSEVGRTYRMTYPLMQNGFPPLNSFHFAMTQGIFSQLKARPCQTLSIHMAPASSGCFSGSIPASRSRCWKTGSVRPRSAPIPR